MPAGRKAIPISEHKRRGTFRASRHKGASEIEMSEPACLPPCPEWLSQEAKFVWEYLAPLLEGRKLVTKSDRIAVESLCCDYAEWMELERSVLEEGKTYTTTTQMGDKMIRPNPKVAMRDSAWKRLQCDLSNFGMHAGARNKVSQVADLKEKNPWQKLAANK